MASKEFTKWDDLIDQIQKATNLQISNGGYYEVELMLSPQDVIYIGKSQLNFLKEYVVKTDINNHTKVMFMDKAQDVIDYVTGLAVAAKYLGDSND